eukprot:gene1621-1777_t
MIQLPQLGRILVNRVKFQKAFLSLPNGSVRFLTSESDKPGSAKRSNPTKEEPARPVTPEDIEKTILHEEDIDKLIPDELLDMERRVKGRRPRPKGGPEGRQGLRPSAFDGENL